MNLTAGQEKLFSEAQRLTQDFIIKRGTFETFALADLGDETLTPLQTTNEFQSAQDAVGGILATLIPLSQQNSLQSVVISTPMNEGTSAVVFDIDHRTDGRVLVFQPYRKKLFGGWAFGQVESKIVESRLFAP